MAALTADRNTPRRDGVQFSRPVAATAHIYAGAIACLSATGYATPGTVATTLKKPGIAQEEVDNSAGADGDLTVLVRHGVFRVANDGTITIADIGNSAYIVDDQTVADNDGTGTRSLAGTIVDVDADGVWVDFA
jgi:hypothetical protein